MTSTEPSLGTSQMNQRGLLGLLLLVLVLNLILVSPELMPTYLDINAFDEAKYIESGRLLLQCQTRNLPWGPVVALVYAPLHLMVGDSLNWFVLEARMGQFVLYLMLWLSTLYLALQFREHVHPAVMVGVLFVSPAFFGVLPNPSDAVFASFSALSLARLISFRNRQVISELAWGSAFLGLGILARLEAIVLIPVFAGVALATPARRGQIARVAAASLLPVIALVGAFVLYSRLTSGSPHTGVSGKAYESFEMNQPVPGGGSVEERRARARELYGTVAENRGSVFRAISKNPSAFADRLRTNALRAPDLYLDLFTRQFGPALFLLTLFGILALFRAGRIDLLVILALWAAQPAISLAFLPIHLIKQIVYLPLLLGAIGAAVVAREKGLSRYVLMGFAALMGLYGLLDSKLALLVAGLVTASALAVGEFSRRISSAKPAPAAIPLLVLLAAGLVLRPTYNFPNYPPIGTTEKEEVVHYLQQTLPPDAIILENLPLPAVAAKLREVSPSEVPTDLRSPEDFHEWLTSRKIQAVFLEGEEGFDATLTDYLEEGEGVHFELGFATGGHRRRVYLVNE